MAMACESNNTSDLVRHCPGSKSSGIPPPGGKLFIGGYLLRRKLAQKTKKVVLAPFHAPSLLKEPTAPGLDPWRGGKVRI